MIQLRNCPAARGTGPLVHGCRILGDVNRNGEVRLGEVSVLGGSVDIHLGVLDDNLVLLRQERFRGVRHLHLGVPDVGGRVLE